MRGYLAFPPPTSGARTLSSPPSDTIRACATLNHQDHHNTAQHEHLEPTPAYDPMIEGERLERRERERALGESSEIEWVRAGGVLRDASGRRDKARTEQIRQELQVQDMEREKMARWDAYEARWRVMQSSMAPITFADFPWPLAAHMPHRDLGPLTRAAVADFLFESLTVRTNVTTRKERIRVSLLRWHPDKISLVLSRVVSDDLELVQEGIHIMFGILKALQDAEGQGGSGESISTDLSLAVRTITYWEDL